MELLFFRYSTSQIGDLTITDNQEENSEQNPEEIKERLRTPKHWKNEIKILRNFATKN